MRILHSALNLVPVLPVKSLLPKQFQSQAELVNSISPTRASEANTLLIENTQ